MKQTGFGILLILIVIGSIIWFQNMGIRECKVAVKDRLRAPSTAIFYDLKEDNYGDGTLIEGKVESQNGFGGMVIQNFVCYKYEDSDPLSVAFGESRISVYEKITENMQKKQE